MKQKMKLYGVALCAAVLIAGASCSGKTQESAPTQEAGLKTESSDNVAEVTVMKLQPKVFTHDVVSNGKATAGEYADLRFNQRGAAIESIGVKNGQRVSKGQVIAVLDRFELENALATAQNSLERSRLDMADALIGQGYDPSKPESVPPEVMELSRLKSGVRQAETELKKAQRALEEATLKAPFDGTVANLFQKAYNLPDESQPFCRVIATGRMTVEFPVLESELALIGSGDAVEITPYSTGKVCRGRVSAINPVVDKDGMVKVTADVDGSAGLYDGMNVKVRVSRDIKEALAVPKSAVVLRSGGRQVVFTHEDGKAIWNYVTKSLENMNEYVVTEGLEPGQEVIVTGNINLAHQAPVKVIPEKNAKE